MNIKIYIDTNIFLDSILNRDEGIADELFTFLEANNVTIILNDISVINIHYFAKKELKGNLELVENYLNRMLDEYLIFSVDEHLLRTALNSSFSDFEDGVQYFCAKEAKADLIISNDKSGFKNSDIEAMKSRDFYERFIG